MPLALHSQQTPPFQRIEDSLNRKRRERIHWNKKQLAQEPSLPVDDGTRKRHGDLRHKVGADMPQPTLPKVSIDADDDYMLPLATMRERVKQGPAVPKQSQEAEAGNGKETESELEGKILEDKVDVGDEVGKLRRNSV